MTVDRITQARHARTVYASGADARNQDLIADVEWILEDADPPATLIRLGYLNAGSLARRLHRAGRPDLARPFWRLDGQNRRDV